MPRPTEKTYQAMLNVPHKEWFFAGQEYKSPAPAWEMARRKGLNCVVVRTYELNCQGRKIHTPVEIAFLYKGETEVRCGKEVC